MMLTDAIVRSVPKVVLHDHLDGGLRPQVREGTDARVIEPE